MSASPGLLRARELRAAGRDVYSIAERLHKEDFCGQTQMRWRYCPKDLVLARRAGLSLLKGE